MNKNVKTTAVEVLQALNQPHFEVNGEQLQANEVFGKALVRIGGLSGVNNPDHVIAIQPNAEDLEVTVGAKQYVLKLKEAEDEVVVTEKAKKALEKKGQEATRKSEELQKVKEIMKKLQKDPNAELPAEDQKLKGKAEEQLAAVENRAKKAQPEAKVDVTIVE